MDDDIREWYEREGTSSSFGPNGDSGSGGGNLESIHDYYEREGRFCTVSPLEAYRRKEEIIRASQLERSSQEKSKNKPIEKKVEPPLDFSI